MLYNAYDDLKHKAGQVMPTFFGWVKEQDKHGQNWEAKKEVQLFATVAKTAMQDDEFVKFYEDQEKSEAEAQSVGDNEVSAVAISEGKCICLVMRAPYAWRSWRE